MPSFFDIIMRGLAPLQSAQGGPLDITVQANPPRYAMPGGPGLPDRPRAIPMQPIPAPAMAAGKPAPVVAAPPPPGAPMGAGTPMALPGLPSGVLPDLARLGQPGAQNAPGGFLDFLSRPDISSALMQAGLGMLAASAPSTNPASGSFAAVAGGGLGGFNHGMEAAREAERQAREDAINEAYKLAIMQGDPNAAPEVVKDGAGNSYTWDGEQYVPFGEGKATGGSSGARAASGTAGGAAKAAEAVAAESAPAPMSSGDIVTQDVDRALALIDKGEWSKTGVGGWLLQNVPGTGAYDLNALFSTIKANIAFDELQKMRENSKTGGALGNVSNVELDLLKSAVGNLDIAQGPEQLKQNLARVRQLYSDIVNYGVDANGNRLSNAPSQSAAPSGELQPGAVVDGYRFLGGDPSNPDNWEAQ